MFNRLFFFKAHRDACIFAVTGNVLSSALLLIKHIDQLDDFISKGEISQGFQDDARVYKPYLDMAIFAVFLGSLAYRYLNTPVDNQQNDILPSARPC
jgi:hypothetical protein